MSRFTIKEIEHLTGIRSHTLRIWEQRYQLPRPKRTPGNVRYYDDDDLKLLLNIAMLNQHGHKISSISKMSEQEILRVAIELSDTTTNSSVHIQSLIAAMVDLDEAAFNKTLSSAILQHGLEKTMMEVIFPFMSLIGVMWQTGSLLPPFEHFMSGLLRQKLMVAIDGQAIQPRPDAKNFLLFLAEGEHHELGLLFANYMIRAAGHRTLYLGQSLPISELECVHEKFKPDFIFTSLTSGYPVEHADELLGALNSKFPYAQQLLTGRYFLEADRDYHSSVRLIRNPDDLRKFLV